MKQKITDILRSIKDWWMNLARKTRIIMLVTLAAILIASLVTVLILNNKNYVLLYNGASPQESATVLATLQEMGIEPRMSTAGAIFVPDDQINGIRMRLAQTGFEGKTFNYDIWSSAGMTATQSDKNKLELFQLQDRLADIIELYDEVEQATVTIGVPEPSLYALQTNTSVPTAAVAIRVKQGKQVTAEQVQTILNLVKSSVVDLEEENITITDTVSDLKLLLDANQNSSLSKLGLTEEVNNNVRTRILNMLQPVYGVNNVQVGVNSVLDTDQKVTERIEYTPKDPDNPMNNPADYVEYGREKLGGEAGPVQGVPGANDNVDVPQYSAQDIDVTDADSFVAQDIIDYLVDSTREEIIKEGLTITDLTVGVLVNAASLDAGKRSEIMDVVAKVAGVPQDNVNVVAVPFTGLTPYTEPDLVGERDLTPVLIATGIAIVALALIFTLIILNMRKKQREAALAAEAALADADYYGEYDENGMPLVDLMEEEEEFQPITIPESAEAKLKAQIRDLAASDPEIVAQLIKTWLVSNT